MFGIQKQAEKIRLVCDRLAERELREACEVRGWCSKNPDFASKSHRRYRECSSRSKTALNVVVLVGHWRSSSRVKEAGIGGPCPGNGLTLRVYLFHVPLPQVMLPIATLQRLVHPQMSYRNCRMVARTRVSNVACRSCSRAGKPSHTPSRILLSAAFAGSTYGAMAAG